MKQARLLLLILLGTFSMIASLAAAPASLNQLKVEFDLAKQDLLESEEKQRSVMSSLFDINKKMKKLVSDRSKVDQKRIVLEDSTRDLAEKIVQLELQMKDQRNLLQKRMRVMDRFGGQGMMRFIFASNSSAELDRNLKILGTVAHRDLSIVNEYASTKKELEVKRVHFVSRLAALKKSQIKVADQERKITHESQAKAKILDHIRKTKSKSLSRLKRLRDRNSQVQNEIGNDLLDLLLRPSFFEKKGHLPTPVQGHLARRFGVWKDPRFNVTMNHKGLYFQTQSASAVTAVFPGKIAFEGSVEGFGSTLILDHGDHYYSVYSGLSELSLSTGQEVRQGQKIASVDEGLYFEIRHFSEPYDPLQWMKGLAP